MNSKNVISKVECLTGNTEVNGITKTLLRCAQTMLYRRRD